MIIRIARRKGAWMKMRRLSRNNDIDILHHSISKTCFHTSRSTVQKHTITPCTEIIIFLCTTGARSTTNDRRDPNHGKSAKTGGSVRTTKK